MNRNLDELRTEILEYLETKGFVVFHGYSRLGDADSFAAWDVEQRPDYRQFLDAAQRVGAKLVVYHHREFAPAHIASMPVAVNIQCHSARHKEVVL